ncbi:MAG TPA: heterodisulfide reductase-related iron-sulfur binding cluster [Tepidisphaeraceae bacterium]|jgi:glycolate oxidase iron-sulfur subunit|nr:heterodisulfide reductase-related iron-sulfur binding cluster [Tepidisphaeraceae bacterium]
MSHTPLILFDDHHPPSSELIDDCVHCGFCLTTCPTYRLWGQEADSPRGRIYLMKLGLTGEVGLNEKTVGHFDRCLGCMACLTSCPSGVQYDKLIEATRSQIERRFDRPTGEKFFRRLIFAIFPYPARLRLLALPLWIYQRTGLRRLLGRARVLSLLPIRWRTMDDLLPTVDFHFLFPRSTFGKSAGTRALSPWRAKSSPPHSADVPEAGANKSTPAGHSPLRVGLLLGCVQRVFFGDVNQATARVLAAEGCEVIVPSGQGCCGALMTHSGEEAMAVEFARRTIDAFDAADVDVIAINAAGCGSAMKEYGHLLRDDPDYADRATKLASKCRDISEILVELTPRAARHPLPIRVAYHDACHLQHAQRVHSQPRALLAAIPKLELLEIQDAAICCGSAGIYNMLQPKAARELGDRKAQNVLDTGADVVASGNPGCTLQLRSCLQSASRPMPVLHWIQLLDASIANRNVADFV